MIRNLKFYRALRPVSPMDGESFEHYVRDSALATFDFSIDDSADCDEEGNLDQDLFFETVTDNLLGCIGIDGWEIDTEISETNAFIVVDMTDCEDKLGTILWPARLVD
jgi:hypothetical protein